MKTDHLLIANEDRIKRLPVWAQQLIETLARQREDAVRQLDRLTAEAPVSPIRYTSMVCDGTKQGPTFRTHYIPDDSVQVVHGGILLEVVTGIEGSISLQWYAEDRASSEVAMIPASFGKVYLKAKGTMR